MRVVGLAGRVCVCVLALVCVGRELVSGHRFFLGSRHELPRFLGNLRNPSSSHGEGDEGGGSRGPGDEEGHAAGDEGQVMKTRN